MTRLIDANKLKKVLTIMANHCGGTLDSLDVFNAIELSPTVERPHGEWIWKEYDPDYDCGDIVCSECSVVIYEGVPQAKLKDISWPFCPDCGARMKEGDKNASTR